MSPAVKYTLGRIGLFVAAFLVLLPFPLSIFLKLVLAVLVSAALSWFVLRGWREQYSLQLQNAVERRKTEKTKLRSALAGDDSPERPAADEPDHPTDSQQSSTNSEQR
ncbi:MAG: DUF4229 domain-containing protein [Hamadaea sp.]|uniref:DUF4229 domain-containing protein n=1 Tax=Hamadaea sp. TaxID=2024425 RepID=UPI0018481786|nr:DUF4229 domain-containing protein [Hamadaea sp.]NUR72043.1 DUF4229 domain-containing protein [Hamadaea sp.]NUT17593.1 DUF4229 domain-containing protein [Hamadaea sp.]